MRIFKRCKWCGRFSLEHEEKTSELKILHKEFEKLTEKRFPKLTNNQKRRMTKWQKNMQVSFIEKHEKSLYDIYDKLMSCYNVVCNHCGNKSTEETMSNDEFKEHGYKLYNKYINFMELEEGAYPSTIDIRIIDGVGGGRADYDEEKKIHFVEMNPLIQRHIFDYEIEATFYHEFTHIIDHYCPITGGKIEDKENNLVWWTEFNASSVQMKRLLGYKSINDKRIISPYDKIVCDHKTFKIINYFDYYKRNEIKESIFNSKNTLSEVFEILRFTMYYLGRVSALKTHFDNNTMRLISNIDDLDNFLKSKLTYKNDDTLITFKWLEDYLIYSTEEINIEFLLAKIYETLLGLMKYIK